MSASDIIRAAIRHRGLDQSGCARLIGWSRQNLSAKLIRNSISADEFLMILDTLGVEFVMKLKNEEYEFKNIEKGVGEDVKVQHNGMQFDTSKASVINTTFYLDGVNKYTAGEAEELYAMCDEKTGELNFFVVTYYEQKRKRSVVRTVSRQEADEFIKRSKSVEEVRKIKNGKSPKTE